MSTRRGHRIVFSWVALLAILLVTFAPTVMGMHAGAGGAPWDQVCSAAKGALGDNSAPTAPNASGHCPYCALHTDLAPPPDPMLADLGIAIAFRAHPVAFTRSPRPNAVWLTGQPRAPPAFA
jgi:hypothetical protein